MENGKTASPAALDSSNSTSVSSLSFGGCRGLPFKLQDSYEASSLSAVGAPHSLTASGFVFNMGD